MMLTTDVLQQIGRYRIVVVVIAGLDVCVQRFHDCFVIVHKVLDHIASVGNLLARVFLQSRMIVEPMQRPGGLTTQLHTANAGLETDNARIGRMVGIVETLIMAAAGSGVPTVDTPFIDRVRAEADRISSLFEAALSGARSAKTTCSTRPTCRSPAPTRSNF